MDFSKDPFCFIEQCLTDAIVGFHADRFVAQRFAKDFLHDVLERFAGRRTISACSGERHSDDRPGDSRQCQVSTVTAQERADLFAQHGSDGLFLDESFRFLHVLIGLTIRRCGRWCAPFSSWPPDRPDVRS